MRPTCSRATRRAVDPRRCRPRPLVLAHAPAAADVKASDLVLAVTGVAVLGAFCLLMASNLLAL